MRMFDRLRALKGVRDTRERLVDVAEEPKGPRHKGKGGGAGVLAGRTGRQSDGVTALR